MAKRIEADATPVIVVGGELSAPAVDNAGDDKKYVILRNDLPTGEGEYFGKDKFGKLEKIGGGMLIAQVKINYVYVDTVNGITKAAGAKKYSLNDKYISLTEAMQDAVSGDKIVLLNATITENNIPIKNGVDIIGSGKFISSSGYIFSDNNVATKVNILGDFSISSTDINGGVINATVLGTNIALKASDVSVLGNLINVAAGAEVSVDILNDIYAPNDNQFVLVSDPASKAFVRARHIDVVGGFAISGDAATYLQVDASSITCQSPNDSPAILFNQGGLSVFNVPVMTGIVPNDLGQGMIISAGPGAVAYINGNLHMVSGGLAVENIGGTIEFHGDISGSGYILSAGAASGFYGNITTSRDAFPSIDHQSGITEVLGRVQNLGATAASSPAVKVSSAGLILRQEAVLVVTTGNNSVAGLAGTQIKSYPGCVANQPIQAGITELVSALLISALVE